MLNRRTFIGGTLAAGAAAVVPEASAPRWQHHTFEYSPEGKAAFSKLEGVKRGQKITTTAYEALELDWWVCREIP